MNTAGKKLESVKELIPYGGAYEQADLKTIRAVEKKYIGEGEGQYKSWGEILVDDLLKNDLVKMEYSMDLKNKYGVEITVEEVLAWETFQDVYDCVKKKIEEKNAKKVATIIEN